MVDEIIEKYKTRYIKELDLMGKKIKKDLEDKLASNQKLLKDLNQKLDETYSLKPIKE
jgi:hypothetical protein